MKPTYTITHPVIVAAYAAFFGLGLGLMAGISAERHDAAAHNAKVAQAADSAARSDYADLVNDCYEGQKESDDPSADGLYSCIATH